MNPKSSCTDTSEYGSLRFDDALNLVLRAIKPVSGYETLNTVNAVHRVLHEDILSAIDVPGNTNSAVDGFAVRFTDLAADGAPTILKISDTILAGSSERKVLSPGTAIKIMTGASLPDGADTVLMQEHVHMEPAKIRTMRTHSAGENVRKAGEDVKNRETVLRASHYCSASDIGLIASLGIGEIRAKRRPRIVVLSTGDEVRSSGSPLQKGQVYDSNRHSLIAALSTQNVTITDLGIFPDDKEKLLEAIDSAAEYADLIISSGGVSVGQADHTKTIAARLGQILIEKVAIKPGRPLVFANIRNKFLFGLPGNPVAVMVTYYQFVLPAVQKIMGIEPRIASWTMKARSLQHIRKKPGRTEFQRGILEKNTEGEWTVRTTGRQGSGILSSMSRANAFIILQHEQDEVNIDDYVVVQPFNGLI